MKSIMLLIIFSSLFMGTLYSQEMIADISKPIETEFGTYYPYPITITPNAPMCDPGENLENVVNLNDYNFSDQELAMLKQNHFVVTPARTEPWRSNASGYNEIFDVYNHCRENGIPIFVTSDAMLHTFHLCFDYILKTCEEKRFIGQLNELLDGLLTKTQQQYEAATDTIIRGALLNNLNYLIVAKKLLDSTYVEPINGGKYLEELVLIEAAQGFFSSPIFEYDEDYTQYIVRGHYTRSDSLRQYFKSMMWLGRMTFACGNHEPFVRYATRRAILLVQAMSTTTIDGRSAMDVWDDIYQPTVFFVGKSDDINFYQYIDIAEKVYGNYFSSMAVDDFADDSLLTAFIEETTKLPDPLITYPGQPKGFRFMGQRFIPDSYILDEVVFSKIPDMRVMPTGLDVMTVLGSKRALELIKQTPDWNIFPSYPAKIDALTQEFASYSAEKWAQNAYWNWLYSLMPLLAVKGAGYPFFVQTSAWIDKDLYAALASWAELRHDTILYAKQSGTETGMPPTSIEEQGYVEPNPHFFGRLASLADFMIAGLDSRDLLFENFKITLETMSQLLIRLKEIAEKELTNTPLSSEDYNTIFEIGKSLYDIATFSPWSSNGPMPIEWNPEVEPMPVIADVHTDANSNTVLEEGVGYPYAIYVICNVEGRPIITKGAGFSYYEFTWPSNDRLTDEKWREMLKSNTPPVHPEWNNSFFVAGDLIQNPMPEFYFWQKPGSVAFHVSIEPEVPRVGDIVQVRFSLSDGWNFDPPQVVVTSPTGVTQNMTEHVQEGTFPLDWKLSLQTDAFTEGMVYIDLDKSLEQGSIDYRASFYLHSRTDVEQSNVELPQQLMLYQNHPNPFNPNTEIQFNLPKPESVVLTIFDINGRMVHKLSGNFSAGTHSVWWNGTDSSGNPMSSGIYYYTLHVGSFADVKRMVLLR